MVLLRFRDSFCVVVSQFRTDFCSRNVQRQLIRAAYDTAYKALQAAILALLPQAWHQTKVNDQTPPHFKKMYFFEVWWGLVVCLGLVPGWG